MLCDFAEFQAGLQDWKWTAVQRFCEGINLLNFFGCRLNREKHIDRQSVNGS